MKLELSYPLTLHKVNQSFGVKDPIYTNLGLLGHNGLDLYALDNSPVYATHSGIVSFSGEDGSGGQTIVIRTTEKFDYNDSTAFYKTIYGHLKRGTFQVKAGDLVIQGQYIASADNTGLSTGSHLHFGLKPVYQGEQDWQWDNIEQSNGYRGAIDPSPFMNRFYHNATELAFAQDVELGESGHEVAGVQLALKAQRLFDHEITGYYGNITKNAVFEFQKKFLSLSWYEKYILKGSTFGPKSRAKMNQIYA